MKAMLTKILSVLLVVTITAGVAITGTLAYLTDRDSEANVFTVGDVSIDLEEDFDQGATLIPGVDIEKEAKITNTGKNDAWVWMTLAIPTALDTDGSASDNVIQWNVPGAFWQGYNKNQTYIESAIAAGYLPTGSTGVADDKTWNVDDAVAMYETEIEGVKYNVYTLLYNSAIKPGETTNIGLCKVYLDDHVDIDPKGDWYHVEGGVVTGPFWNNATNGNPVIYVSAYAMQADGFNTALDAYTAYNAQWTTDAGENKGLEWGAPATVAASADEMIATLEKGEDVILTDDIKIDPAGMSNAYGATGINIKNGQTIYGGGKTLDIKGAGGTWDSGICTTGGLIQDLTVTGSFRGIFINHNSTHSERVVLENVTIDGTTYTISCDQGMNQGLTATNSTFNGWTSYAATLGDAKFIDCSFGAGNGYAYCRPYAPTEFIGCEFAVGYQMDARAAVTFENCTIGGVALTADNLSTLVTGNIVNATVK